MARGIGSITLTNATGSRTFIVSEAVGQRGLDRTPGQQVNYTVETTSSGATPPGAGTARITWKDRNGSQVGSQSSLYNTSVNPTTTDYYEFSSSPYALAAAPHAGVIEMDLRVTLGGIAGYDVSTDGQGTQSLPAGTTVTNRDRYVQRALTPATLRSGRGVAVADTPVLSFGDEWRVQYEWDVPVYAMSGSLAIRGDDGQGLFLLSQPSFSVSTGQRSTVILIASAVGNQYPVGPLAVTIEPDLNSGPGILRPATPDGTYTFTQNPNVDNRLTVTRLVQHNDNIFGAPPLGKDKGVQRLTSDLSFLSSRLTNARTEGVNGVFVSRSLRDAGQLVPAVTQASEATATAGGQAGWLPTLIPWSSALPTGTWNLTHTASSPASGLLFPAVTPHSLVAADPNLHVIAAGGPGTTITDSRHFVPGEPFISGMAVFHVGRSEMVACDASSPAVALARFNIANGTAEVLQADLTTWLPAQQPGAVVYHPASETYPGSMAYIVYVPPEATGTWSSSDVFSLAKATVGGVPVTGSQKEIAVTGVNNHTTYEFDALAFLGLGGER